MGSQPVDGVADSGWFEFYDDTIEVDPSSAADRAFLAGLRARAVSHAWPGDPDDTWAYHVIDDDQHLLRVGMWLDDNESDNKRRPLLLAYGVEFDGTRIVGGQSYPDIPFDLEGPTELEFSGSVEFLVERAAEQFEWLLSWPIERLRQWRATGSGSLRAPSGGSDADESEPNRPPDRITLRGVREPEQPEADHGGGRKRWWSFGKRRG